MKRQISVRRNGAVLLMILGLMAMFAISILTYMVVTSNMAETAQNSAKLDATLEIPVQEDLDVALKSVVIGSSNERNPIGPFSILENMYGDWKEYNEGEEKTSDFFQAYLNIFPEQGIAIVAPIFDTHGDEIRNFGSESEKVSAMMEMFEESGGVLTFGDSWGMPNEVIGEQWNNIVKNTSTFVIEKVVTNPKSLFYKVGTEGTFWAEHYCLNDTVYNDQTNFFPCDAWHFKVELTDEIKKFVETCGFSGYNVTGEKNINLAFNELEPTVEVRLNRPAFSGTGAGGFTPGHVKDASVTPEIKDAVSGSRFEGMADQLRIPFAFWGNAAAPDLYPYRRTASSKLSFRSYWAQLTDVNYDALQRQYNGSLRYTYWDGGDWGSNNPVTGGFQDGAYLEPARMNPPYTAPDHRSPFLAHFNGFAMTEDELEGTASSPSFHRPSMFKTYVDFNPKLEDSYLGLFSGLYGTAGMDVDSCVTSIIRKLTPRPLPLDHWNFNGGNPNLDYWSNSLTTKDVAQRLAGRALDPESGNYEDRNGVWDVDNDGDGVREGVWVPSGLPIRVDKNGTPYATMFSYTVVDLDGRVNVNTAGNWDQLPNKREGKEIGVDGNRGNNNRFPQPYNYLDELGNVASGISSEVDQPFFGVQILNEWRDDNNNVVTKAVRGDGRGTASVLLYDTLEDIFENSPNVMIQTIASNLLWRRNLELNKDPRGKVDQSGLAWKTNARMGSQPGYQEGGSQVDDAQSTIQNFFGYMDPFQVFNTSDSSSYYIFPYRGKTTIDNALELSAAVYDFANTAFRSYDPLGAQIYTYAPSYTRNPYLATQYAHTWQDSPYTLPMLERLLRPWDSDSASLPTQLVDDLGMNSDLYGDLVAERDRVAARQSLTTLSSDVPSPSLVFPSNKKLEDGEFRSGHFGFIDLMRNCVRQELYKVFLSHGICNKFASDGTENIGSYDFVVPQNEVVFNEKVEEITAYLTTLLPPEILAGEKIDLNALSQKNYWLDVDTDEGDYVQAGTDLHNVGLVKRMERARGLYLVMMTLLYEDLNANFMYGVNDAPIDPSDSSPDPTPEYLKKFDGYIEGSFDLLSFEKGPDSDQKKNLFAQQLTATRIAQWCVNAIDFADPDATMTPFFFDPTPFDGWWVYDNTWITDSSWVDGIISGVGPEIHYLFDPQYGTPNEQMFKFFVNALNNGHDINIEDGSEYERPNYVDANDGEVTIKYGDKKKKIIRLDGYIAKWLSKEIEDIKDQSCDLGFRLAWGMERPDLLLTETLSFHDLGIADTEWEADTDSPSKTDADDFDFDQVKRPEGSTYLELYCAANPNVPQSPELYDYVDGKWQLRLSKVTPIYTDSLGRELEMPVWRVAISASADPRDLRTKDLAGKDDVEKKEAKKSNKFVYNKRYNSVLEWLTPAKKDHDDYQNDFSFFSMQPRQFRNYPTLFDPENNIPVEVSSIGELDIIQEIEGEGENVKPKELDESKFLPDWKTFNLSSSNILGSAVADTYTESYNREVELDRIVWFVNGKGDEHHDEGKKLGTAGSYPDALRLFVNESSERCHLAPNQYLVVGPEKKRRIGSVPYNKTRSAGGEEPDGHFNVDQDTNCIDLDNLGTGCNHKYIVVKANIGGRGLNISEPLWTGAKVDPYELLSGATGKKMMIDPSVESGKIGTKQPDDDDSLVRYSVINTPFELPGQWCNGGDNNKRVDVTDDFYKNTIKKYPIVEDEIFGIGTIPAYKSAFVQRVADPNRPYHPLMNPYITVDWNMMDLTVYTGECVQEQSMYQGTGLSPEFEKKPFSKKGGETGYPFTDDNKIKLAENGALDLKKNGSDGIYLPLNETFSSRQWGNAAQRTFAPMLDNGYFPVRRPNPWARAFKGEGGKAGLQTPNDIDVSGLTENVPVINKAPKHTLGWYNNIGPWGKWVEEPDAEGNNQWVWKDHNAVDVIGSEFRGLDPSFMGVDDVYKGTPRAPFEHLIWNDAPYSNPMELTMVPASAPGRFGLEFVRDKANFNLKELYKVDKEKGGSLGSYGVFGFKDWYNKYYYDLNNDKRELKELSADPDKLNKLKDKAGRMGPYLNFFSSSKRAGETLNFCKMLEFVYVPSLYLGTKRLAKDLNGNAILDDNGNTIFFSKRREPGKINLNTVNEYAWHGLSPNSDRVAKGERLPGSTWEEFFGSRHPYQTTQDRVTGNWDVVPKDVFHYFQPSHTNNLYVQMDGSKPPIPTYMSILAQRDLDLIIDNSVEEDPVFDNVSPVDDAGETLYTITYFTTPNDESTRQVEQGTMARVDALEHQYGGDNVRYDELKIPRNNLYEATAEMQRLSGLTTTRSNTFAIWVTVGYFEVERCMPGTNMPAVDPDGVPLTVERLTNNLDKWYHYYQAIYPDGYTYGKELGSEFGETKRRRGFSIIDRSIPVDYRRGSSWNWKDAVLLQRLID